jgi:hypothetical protein
LTILAEQLIIDLLASGDWKRTLVFSMDLGLVHHLFIAPGGLFQAIVRLSLQALAAQLPLLLPHVQALTIAFDGIMTGRAGLPKAFTHSEDFRLVVPALQDMLASFSSAWADHTALEPFVANTLRLPILLGEMFGYRKFVYVVDHIDLADVTLTQTPPFTGAETNVFLLEQLKFALDSASFLVSSKRLNAIDELFPSFYPGTVDLTRGLDSLSTLDLISAESDAAFQIAFLDDSPIFSLRLQHFGGCAAFLRVWKDLELRADAIDAATQAGTDVDEPHLFLCALVDHVLGLLFVGSDGGSRIPAVKSAARVNKPHQ